SLVGFGCGAPEVRAATPRGNGQSAHPCRKSKKEQETQENRQVLDYFPAQNSAGLFSVKSRTTKSARPAGFLRGIGINQPISNSWGAVARTRGGPPLGPLWRLASPK